ncbi:MAG: glycerophosphodiester phosphodiesterase [Nannocystaceae bacterium]
MPAVSRPYFAGSRPLAFAHRGGAKHRPENTLLAFEEAARLGFTHIETDIHLTRDGEIVVFHDEILDRLTNGHGPVRTKTLAQLQRLDAAYSFTHDGHRFPYRGRGITIPTLEQALALAPELRFNLEIKPHGPGLVHALWEFVRRRNDCDRLLVASGHAPTVAAFRRVSGGALATSAGAGEIFRFWAAAKAGLHTRLPVSYDALQVPPSHGPLTVVEPRFLRCARERDLHVHVWTIDDPAEMQRLVGLGVDGIMTDEPQRLMKVLGR